MEVVEITKENREAYLPYIDVDAAEQIERGSCRAVISQNAAGGIDAVLIYRPQEQANDGSGQKIAYLTYFYAKDSESGLALLDACRQSCADEGLMAIVLEVEEEKRDATLKLLGMPDDCCHPAESGKLSVTVADFMDLPFSARAPKLEHITSIGTLTLNQMRRGIMNCLYCNRTGMLPDLATIPVSWFEPELSSCVLIDGSVCGFLLIHRQPSGVLNAELLYASDPADKKDMIGMIRYSVEQLVKKYPADTRVVIPCCNETTRILTDKLFPGKKKNRMVRIVEQQLHADKKEHESGYN